MTDSAKTTLNRAAYFALGFLLMMLVASLGWAYQDRVSYDEMQDRHIYNVDMDLQHYKVHVAETQPTKADIIELRRAIDALQEEIRHTKKGR